MEFESLILETIKALSLDDFAKRIDHTLLNPQSKVHDIERVCKEALEIGFAACYISPWYVKEARKILKDSEVKVGSVVSFPHGNSPIDVKVHEAKWLIENGAEEVDMVVNLNALKSHMWDYLANEISKVAKVVHEYDCILKVIVETGILSDDEKVKIAQIVAKSGGDYVKTSTGFIGRGATLHDVHLLKKAVSGRIKVKASGGIRHAIDAIMLIIAGADRIGTSAGVTIFNEFKRLKEGSIDSISKLPFFNINYSGSV